MSSPYAKNFFGQKTALQRHFSGFWAFLPEKNFVTGRKFFANVAHMLYTSAGVMKMPRTEAQKRARQNYEAKAYDVVSFKARKGTGAAYTEAAAALGIGKMEMFRRAVDEFIARHVGTAGGFRRADETPPQPAETAENGTSGEGIPITFAHVDQTAQNQPVSAKVQTIVPAAETAPNRITAADKRLFDAVNALSPESKKALLKFLQTLQG